MAGVIVKTATCIAPTVQRKRSHVAHPKWVVRARLQISRVNGTAFGDRIITLLCTASTERSMSPIAQCTGYAGGLREEGVGLANHSAVHNKCARTKPEVRTACGHVEYLFMHSAVG